ncbi:MAG: hypothetical protein ACTS10_21450 [Kiloniellales bacterium]
MHLTVAILLLLATFSLPAWAQDRAYWWPSDPTPDAFPHGLLLLGSATAAQRHAAIRGFLQPLGHHDLPAGQSSVPLYVPVMPDTRATDTGIPTEWSDDLFLERHWDHDRDAALRSSLGLTGGPLVIYRTGGPTLVADLSGASPFWLRHWILAYRRAAASAPSPARLSAELQAILPEAPVMLDLR